MQTVLLADSNSFRRATLAASVRNGGCRVLETVPADLLATHNLHRPAASIVAADDGQALTVIGAIRDMRQRAPRECIVLVASSGSEALAIAAFRAGATDYFSGPAVGEQAVAAVLRALAADEAPGPARCAAPSAASLAGSSPSMHDVWARVSRVAAHDTTVLITGETGTGKELAASLLHAASARHNRQFLPINCAAIPDTLLESELFGHERGAFTGATAARPGMLQRAQGGTVFLDEVGELSPVGQAKILRAVEAREIVPVGGRTAVPLDVRIVAATNQDLDRAVASGKFRKDLYFRLNVVRIHLPPLRQRASDVPSLLTHFLDRLRAEPGRPARRFTDEAVAHLQAYGWPGNVRELKNLVEAVLADTAATTIGVADLPRDFAARLPAGAAPFDARRERLIEALTEARWNKSRAARQLRCSRMTLYRWMARERVSDREG